MGDIPTPLSGVTASVERRRKAAIVRAKPSRSAAKGWAIPATPRTPTPEAEARPDNHRCKRCVGHVQGTFVQEKDGTEDEQRGRQGVDWRTQGLFRRMVGVSQDAQDNGQAGDLGQFWKVNRAGRDVSSVLWLPSSPVRPPVVLVAHGGSGYKTDEFIVRMAGQLLKRGIAVLAIDAPFHGDRSVPGDGQRSYLDHMASQGMTEVCEETCADWVAALDDVSSRAVDTTRIGFIGLSMGSNFGIPLCAQLGDRLRCAVVGKLGLVVAGGYPSIVAASADVTDAAQRLTAPVLMHMQWDDEVFTREGQLALFDLIGSSNKQLRARPGPHSSTHPEDEESWVAFLARHLGSQGVSNQDCRA